MLDKDEMSDEMLVEAFRNASRNEKSFHFEGWIPLEGKTEEEEKAEIEEIVSRIYPRYSIDPLSYRPGMLETVKRTVAINEPMMHLGGIIIDAIWDEDHPDFRPDLIGLECTALADALVELGMVAPLPRTTPPRPALEVAVEKLEEMGLNHQGFNSIKKKPGDPPLEWYPAPEIHPEAEKAILDGEYIYNLPHRVLPSMDYYSDRIARR